MRNCVIATGALLGFLFMSLTGPNCFSAEEPAAAPETAASSPEKGLPPPPSPEEYKGLRDPFWPTGYQPASEAADTQQAPELSHGDPQWDEALKQLSMKGVMKLGREFVATINDQIVKENDTVSVDFEHYHYSWRIRSISQKGVRFEPLDVKAL